MIAKTEAIAAARAFYTAYRRNVPLAPEAAPILERFVEPPFHSYERIFVSPLSPDA